MAETTPPKTFAQLVTYLSVTELKAIDGNLLKQYPVVGTVSDERQRGVITLEILPEALLNNDSVTAAMQPASPAISMISPPPARVGRTASALPYTYSYEYTFSTAHLFFHFDGANNDRLVRITLRNAR